MTNRRLIFVLFVLFLVATLWTGGLLQTHGKPLVRHPACHGIGTLELTAFPSAARQIVERWSGDKDKSGRSLNLLAIEDIHWDYGFIILYVGAFALAGLVGRFLFDGWLASKGAALARAMILAGILDYLEDFGMTMELNTRYGIAPVVFTVSLVKWIIVFCGIAYASAVLLALPWRWRRLLLR